jgi:aminopeptidase N
LTEKAADSDDIFVDYKGERISELVVNGTKVAKGAPFRDHRIYFPREHLRQGANVVSVRFVSKYTKDCMGV